MSRRIVIPLALAAAVALLVPTSAGAVIRVNKGMFGVSLGHTMKQVKRKLGRPGDVRRDRRLRETDWFYARRELMVAFKDRTRRVVYLATENPRERTASGVGVGSTEQEVLAGVPGTACETFRGRRVCSVHTRRAGTIFGVEAGVVEHVAILR